MAKLSKRKQAIRAKVDRTKLYPVDEALSLLKEVASAKFSESVDVAVNLGVDPRKSDQVVRGATVRNAKAGQVRYRTDKGGIIHATIGKVEFEVEALKQNLIALVSDLNKIKPAAAKGVYLKKMTVSSTMGPGIGVDIASIGQQ